MCFIQNRTEPNSDMVGSSKMYQLEILHGRKRIWIDGLMAYLCILKRYFINHEKVMLETPLQSSKKTPLLIAYLSPKEAPKAPLLLICVIPSRLLCPPVFQTAVVEDEGVDSERERERDFKFSFNLLKYFDGLRGSWIGEFSGHAHRDFVISHKLAEIFFLFSTWLPFWIGGVVDSRGVICIIYINFKKIKKNFKFFWKYNIWNFLKIKRIASKIWK